MVDATRKSKAAKQSYSANSPEPLGPVNAEELFVCYLKCASFTLFMDN